MRCRSAPRRAGLLRASAYAESVSPTQRRAAFLLLAVLVASALAYVVLSAVDIANSTSDGTDSKGMVLVSSTVLGLLLSGSLIGCLLAAMRAGNRPPER